MKGFSSDRPINAALDPATTAIVGLHWQVDVVEPKGAFGAVFGESVKKSGVVPRTARLLDKARDAGCLIIYVNIVYRPGYSGTVVNNVLFQRAIDSGGFIQGTPGVDIIQELRPAPNDIVIDHLRSSAFFGSDLLTILIGRGIDTVCLSGIATNVAVDHSARDAMQYGFKTYLLHDCCFSSDPEHHEAALVTMRVLCTGVVSADELIQLLQAHSPN